MATTNLPKARWILFHDDDCGLPLFDGLCEKCGYHPDMQSTAFYIKCSKCDVELKTQEANKDIRICPSCNTEHSWRQR